MDGSLLSILTGKYFNQNLICFIIAYVGAFFANKYAVCELSVICTGLLWISTISLFATLFAYAFEYCSKRYYKAKCHKVRYNYVKRIATQESPTMTTKTEEGKNKETKEIILPKDIVDWGGQ
jgi:predicted membrane protein